MSRIVLANTTILEDLDFVVDIRFKYLEVERCGTGRACYLPDPKLVSAFVVEGYPVWGINVAVIISTEEVRFVEFAIVGCCQADPSCTLVHWPVMSCQR